MRSDCFRDTGPGEPSCCGTQRGCMIVQVAPITFELTSMIVTQVLSVTVAMAVKVFVTRATVAEAVNGACDLQH